MKVLIVDAFLNPSETAAHGRGKTGFALFHALVLSLLQGIPSIPGAAMFATSPPIIQVVKVLDLNKAKLYCDVESIDADSKVVAENFDLIDIIFAGGDVTDPFDPNLVQLITLCHMANLTNKPMFSCGGAALVEIVSLSGNGKKWNVLNGTNGSTLMDLPTFPFYSSSRGNFMSTFFAAESGDMYMFQDGAWNPYCNVGLHRIGRKGKALCSRLRTAPLNFSFDDHVKNTPKEVEAISADLDNKLYIDSKFIQHWAFKNVAASRAFLVTSLGDWAINSEWSCKSPKPHSLSPIVLATGKDSPVLIQLGNKLILASEINDGKAWGNLEHVLGNFIQHTVSLIMSTSFEVQRQTTGSLFHNIFDGGCDMLSSLTQCHAVAKSMMHTVLPHGPEKLDVPWLGQAFTDKVRPLQGTNTNETYSLQAPFKFAPSKTSTGTSYSPRTVQNPLNFTISRLASIIAANGQGVPVSLQVMHQSVSTLNGNIARVISPIRPSERKPSGASTRKVVNVEYQNENVSQKATRVCIPDINEDQSALALKTSNFMAETTTSATFLPGWTEMMKQETLPLGIETSFGMECTNAYIPHHSPRSLSHSTELGQSQRTYVTSPRDITPYNTYKKIMKKKAKAAAANPTYKGQYTEVFLSPREKNMKDEFMRKKTVFIGEKNFITSFGKSTALPLRAEGQIRAFGDYEKDHISMAGIKMEDRAGLRVDERNKHLAGHWKS